MGCGNGCLSPANRVALTGAAAMLWGCAEAVSPQPSPARGPSITPPAKAETTAEAGDAPPILWDIFFDALAGATAPGRMIGRFHITFYWIEPEAAATGPLRALRDRRCKVIARVPATFKKRVRLQGTGRLEDGRLVSVSRRCKCGSRCFFVVKNHRWGIGAAMRPLVPFRSIAVDRGVIALGERVYIPALDGVRVPGDEPWGGFVHDGCVRADDVGGGINGRHIDFFTGGRWGFADLAINRKHTVTLRAGGKRCAKSDGAHIDL